MKHRSTGAGIAWLLTTVYYFYRDVLPTTPSVRMPQLSEGFALSSLGVAALVGVFYYGYSPFSLVAVAALDRVGAATVVSAGGGEMGLKHYQPTFQPLLYGVALAIVLTFLVKETGPSSAANKTRSEGVKTV
jgi:hypothetical protein